MARPTNAICKTKSKVRTIINMHVMELHITTSNLRSWKHVVTCDIAQVLNQWLVWTSYKPTCNNKIPFRSLPQPIVTPKIHLAHKTSCG